MNKYLLTITVIIYILTRKGVWAAEGGLESQSERQTKGDSTVWLFFKG